MALTIAGAKELGYVAAGYGVAFDHAHAYIGVGNGTAAFSTSQNDLVGSSKFRKAMDVGYPVVNGNVVTFRATFSQAEANFAWNEWGIFNAESGGVMLNRSVEGNGTKQDNQTWVMEVSLTFDV